MSLALRGYRQFVHLFLVRRTIIQRDAVPFTGLQIGY